MHDDGYKRLAAAKSLLAFAHNGEEEGEGKIGLAHVSYYIWIL